MRAIARLRETLRAHRNSDRLIVRLGIESAAAVYGCIRAPAKFCVDGAYRSVIWLRLFRRQDLHQSTPLTWMDRYPEIFSVCRDYLIGKPDLRILSYGCATGEEVLTLRNYLPAAFIVGAEINRHSLAVSRQRKVDDRIVFLESDRAKIRETVPLDAIFCLAVLQRTPMRIINQRIRSLKGIYPFEKFDEKVTELDSCLKRNGLLVVHHSQYLFADASVASKYAPLITAMHIRNKGPKFDRRSSRLDDAPADNSVFVKVRE